MSRAWVANKKAGCPGFLDSQPDALMLRRKTLDGLH